MVHHQAVRICISLYEEVQNIKQLPLTHAVNQVVNDALMDHPRGIVMLMENGQENNHPVLVSITFVLYYHLSRTTFL